MTGHRGWCVALTFAVSFGAACADDHYDTLSAGPKAYRDVTIVEADAYGIDIVHAAGRDHVPFRELEKPIQDRYGYDPGKIAPNFRRADDAAHIDPDTVAAIQKAFYREVGSRWFFAVTKSKRVGTGTVWLELFVRSDGTLGDLTVFKERGDSGVLREISLAAIRESFPLASFPEALARQSGGFADDITFTTEGGAQAAPSFP